MCFINSEGFLAEVFHPWVRWEGPGSGFENSSGGGVWVGPSWAQVGGPKLGPSGWAQAGLKWAQARNLEPQKNQKIKNSQNQNPFCPKCRQGFLCRKKKRPRPNWGPPGQFFPWAGKIKKMHNFCLFSLVGQWALFTRFRLAVCVY